MTAKELLCMILEDIYSGNGPFFIIGYYKPDIPMPIDRFRHVISIANSSLVGGYTNNEVCFALREENLPDKFKINRL